MKCSVLIAAVLSVLVLVSGAGAQSHFYGTWEFDPAYWQACETTINVMNANPAAADPAFAANNLRTITGTDPLLMTCYTDYTGYQKGTPGTVGAGRSVWVTRGTDLYDFHVANDTAPGDMGIRTRQLLGMPSFKENDRVVEMIVSPTDMFRPARNPDMSLTATPLTYPDYQDSDRPAFLPTAFDNWGQFKAWMTSTANSVYKLDGTGVPYPWTQLGYTYDWGNPADIVGLSEFVIQGAAAPHPTTTVEVHAVVSEQSYRCYYRDGENVGNFDVFGSLDTIWVGSRYTPVAAAGNRWVRIQDDCTVHQGITVSSEGYVITNYGTIAGPGKNVDRTLRDSALEFEEGGTLRNAEGGTVASPIVAVHGRTATDRPTVIDNSGFILSEQTAILTEAGDDVITNDGTIIGDVSTGAGDDVFTLNGGVIVGNIDAGAGTANLLTIDPGAGDTAGVRGNIVNLNGPIEIESGIGFLNGTIGTAQTPIDVVVRNHATMATETPTVVGITQIHGNLTLDAGATLNIKFSKPAEDVFDGDKVMATGQVNLATGSVIHVDHVAGSRSPIRTDEIFTVVTAAGGVYDDSTSDGQVVTGGVSFTTDSAFVGLTSNIKWPWNPANPHPRPTALRLQPYRLRSFESLASGANNRAMAAALDAGHNQSEGDYAVLSNELLFMNEAEYAQSLPTLSPAPYHALPAVARRSTQDLATSLSDYLRTRRASLCCGPVRPCGGGCGMSCVSDCGECLGSCGETCGDDGCVGAACATADGPCVFVRSVGLFFNQGATEDRVGFRSGAPGVQLTFDRLLGYNLIGGVEFAYVGSNISFDEHRGGADSAMYRVGPYLTWCNDDGFFLDASATYGYHDNDVNRHVLYNDYQYTSHGGFDAHDSSVYLAAGRDYCYGSLLVTPTVSLQHIYYGQAGFTETDAAGANLRLAHYDTHSLRSMVGLRAARMIAWRCRCIMPEFFAGWAHEYLANESLESEFIGGVPFRTSPGDVLRDSGYFGGGLTVMLPRGGYLFSRYRGEMFSDSDFHACDLGLVLQY